MSRFPQPGRAWRIDRGSVDIFFELPSTLGEGARRYLFHVDGPGLVFGLTGPFIALYPNDTEFTDIPREEAISGLAPWIELMTAAIVPARPPANCIALEPGIEIESSADPVSPLAGMLWVTVLEGEARFLGDAAGESFPVSSNAWLQPVGAARFTASESPSWAAFDHFQSLAHTALSALAAREESSERERASRRRRFDADRMSRAIRELAAPLDPKSRVHASSSSNPWLAACQAIGQTIGIEFNTPPDLAAKPGDMVRSLAESAKARYRAVLLQGRWWTSEHGPLLATRESDRAPLAMLPAGRRYVCFDPATGQRAPVTKEIAATLDPYAYSFYAPFPANDRGLGALMMFGLRSVKPELLLVVIAGFGASITALATPLATGYIFDTLIPGAQRGSIATICALLLVAAFSGVAFALLRGVALLRLEGRMDVSMQSALWIRLLELPPSFFRNYSAGDLATRGLGVQTIRQVLTGSAVTTILAGIFSLSSLALLFHFNARLALYGFALSGVPPIVVLIGGRFQIRQQRQLAEVHGKLYGMLLQLIGGVAKIRVSAAEPRAFAAWASRFSTLRAISIRSRVLTNRIAVFQRAWPAVCFIILFSVYSEGVETMTTGAFIAFLSAFTQLLTGMLGIVTSLNSIAAAAPAYERARPILEALPETSGMRAQPGQLTGQIDIRHVCFRYSADTPLILNDVSITIEPGQFVAIVGPSGSGKSTLFRMLLGFETPESGSVCYDQHDLAHLEPPAVRRQIGVVLQNGRIRAGSIFENIIGASQLTLDDAWAAARMAGFAADIETFPMGMHTMLSEGGGTLSGGQRQRLIIARALVRRPRMLLFDEATSALDNRTQAQVTHSLDNLRATRIVIAHRLSTIEKADCIYVLERGRLVEKGNYTELMAMNGTFAALAKRQIT